MRTLAPGTPALEGSVTVPSILPLACARNLKGVARSNAATTAHKNKSPLTLPRLKRMWPPRCHGGRSARGRIGQRRGRLFDLRLSRFIPGKEQRSGYRSNDRAGQRRQVSYVTDSTSGLGTGCILMPVSNAKRQQEK